MSDRFELAKSWFNTANEDILAAEHEMRYEDAILRSVCFHCQQAVEKYIKGFIIYLDGEFSYTHDIFRLLNELKTYENELSLNDISPDKLTVYAVEARYPDPDTIITLDRAKEALAIAYEVRNPILEKIN